MVSISFADPVYLWFLFSLPILIVSHSITFKNTQKKALRFANFEAISRVTGAEFIKKNVYLLVIRLIILALIVFAVSGTTITYAGISTGSNYILAIDSSASMLVQDINPSRLNAAQETSISFLDFLPSRTKVGLVTFAGAVLIESNLETDFEKLKNSIRRIDVSQIGGTDLGNTIVTSSNMLIAEKDQVSKVIILITDGQSNIGIPLETAVDYAVVNKILIHTIGIGTEEGGKFIGTDVVSKLDEENLKNIAELTGGNFFKAESKEKILQSFSEISKFNRKKIAVDMTFSFMLIALFFLLIEWGLINTRHKIIP
ncbi:MAG: VWA domain-containing protein [Nanoarchaeota archaeon]